MRNYLGKFQPICIPEPTIKIWEKNVSGFQDKWRFINYLDYIDGKAQRDQVPKKL